MSAPCGTHAGYHRHRRRAEPPCDACQQARNAYDRHYRRSGRPAVARRRAYNAAHGRALHRLADRRRAEFLVLLDDELAGAAVQEEVKTG